MATALGGESPPSRQQNQDCSREASQCPTNSSSWLHYHQQQQQQQSHCVCHCHHNRGRRNSDIKRPATAVGWSQQPQSSVVSPPVRPATAIGWEDKRDVGRRSRDRDWKEVSTEEEDESDRSRGMGGGHSASYSSAEGSKSSRVSTECVFS